MKWFKQQRQEIVSPEAFAAFLLKITHDIVNNSSQTLKKHLDAADLSKLSKVEDELTFFLVFALEYWWTTDSNRTQKERRIVRQAFETHLANIVSLDTLQERLNSYARIVNMNKGDEAKFLGFGMLLSEYSDMTDNPFLLVLAPDLFTKALESLVKLKSVQIKSH